MARYQTLGTIVVACGVIFPAGALLAQAIPGKVMHVANSRDLAFCEMVVMTGKAPDARAEFYSTVGTSDCPASKFDAIDARKLAAELKADSVLPIPRRHWVHDQVWAFSVGKTEDFGGVKATWIASLAPEVLKAGIKVPFTPIEVHRQAKYLYAKGKPVFLLRTPDGRVYVLQSYTDQVDKSLSLSTLPALGDKLKLPQGWKFETKVLDRDLTIDPRSADGIAHITEDNLEGRYEGCGFDAACSYVP